MSANEFLNSKSMVTPGIAGGTVMLITNALGAQFDLPHRWIALALSFAVGLIAFADRNADWWQRPVFYLLNSLLIFAIAVGSNTVGTAVNPGAKSPGFLPGGAHAASREPFFEDWFDPVE
jgi:hypothetical protein